MKPLFFLLILLPAKGLFAQRKVVVADIGHKQPLENVIITGPTGELLAVTNRFGLAVIPTGEKTLTVRCSGYYPLEHLLFSDMRDTLFLRSEISDLEEITVRYISDSDLLKRIVSKSRDNVARNGVSGELKYHLSNWIIVHDTVKDLWDTITVNTMCSFYFERSPGKREHYRFYPGEGHRYLVPHVWKNTGYSRSDMVRIFGSHFRHFDRLFAFELTDASRLMIKSACTSTRQQDSISLLTFDCSDGMREYYYTQDTLLNSCSDSYGSGNLLFADYRFFGDRYFLDHALEEFQGEMTQGALKMRIIVLQTIEVVHLNDRKPGKSTEEVDPAMHIKALPYTEEIIFAVQEPSL